MYSFFLFSRAVMGASHQTTLDFVRNQLTHYFQNKNKIQPYIYTYTHICLKFLSPPVFALMFVAHSILVSQKKNLSKTKSTNQRKRKKMYIFILKKLKSASEDIYMFIYIYIYFKISSNRYHYYCFFFGFGLLKQKRKKKKTEQNDAHQNSKYLVPKTEFS